MTGSVETSLGPIRRISTELRLIDSYWNLKARLGIARDTFKIPPGLYAIGNPDANSPVLVTCNYKLTIDIVRVSLDGIDTWLLVIDTKGVNVWCAAGKGTFSTEEIIYRIQKYQIKELVSHNTIIVPQLGAPGITAHEITKFAGFKVIYGPVYAKDIPMFLSNQNVATEDMRRVNFTLRERLAVAPLETFMAIHYLPYVIIFFVLLQWFGGNHTSIIQVVQSGLMNTVPYLIAILIGTLAFPMLLPVLPFQMFAVKALILGLSWSAVVFAFANVFHFEQSIAVGAANMLLLASIISFLAMNFTGSTTFTSLSGVKKETTIAVPTMAIASAIAIVLMILGFLL
ncbi:hypothetical protein BHU72_10475 [Desulfuribacillus stibiiarsenatis]|uniref:CO dehydrogenase/acetyl-CoA synthase delta subunit TIM barrel domain-containing protein n=1 Tax=Desulfuribacillus stibiiarsenatis TaxID=1390249 RepID=A0A1E5L9I2_9FIRM|nr:hypothetical protein BHU72_10475 [Desulfuribacillus stibiiarsenatis]